MTYHWNSAKLWVCISKDRQLYIRVILLKFARNDRKSPGGTASTYADAREPRILAAQIETRAFSKLVFLHANCGRTPEDKLGIVPIMDNTSAGSHKSGQRRSSDTGDIDTNMNSDRWNTAYVRTLILVLFCSRRCVTGPHPPCRILLLA